MSFSENAYSAGLKAAVDYAWDNGIVLVASAGNNGTNGTEVYPAAYENVIAVAATDQNNQRASFSNAGDYVDVAAPGVGIWSSTPTYANSYAPSYASLDGTSMAAPHVSGLAGLIFSRGFVSNAQVRNQIESQATNLGTAGKDPVSGHGLIDAYHSVENMIPVAYQQDSSKITYSGSDWKTYHWSDYQGTYTYTNWASRSGATAKLSFLGTSVTWWANRGPYGGKAKVYVDGAHAQTVDLYSARNEPTQPAFSKSWGSTHGSHTIEIVVEGTSGRPWVDVDAFTVTQPLACYRSNCG